MITPTDAANALTYLLAARALTAVDGQATVWADYLNHEVRDPQAGELLPACRRAIREWSADRRAYQIDVERMAAAIRRARTERVTAEEQARGPLLPDGGLDPAREIAWRRAAMDALGAGAPRDRAEAAGWAAIGSEPPPPGLPVSAESGRDRARRMAAELAARHRMAGPSRSHAPNRRPVAPGAA